MKKFTLLISAAVAIAVCGGYAVAQGHRGGGSGSSGSGGWQGSRGGGGQAQPGVNGGHSGGRHWDGGGGRGGSYRGGHWGASNHWYGHGGSWRGYYAGSRRWYGGWGYPYAYGYYPYAYPGYVAPYPVYADVAPPVYIERPPVYAEPPPPVYDEPPPPEPSRRTIPTPERLERFTLSARELFEFDRYSLRMPQPKLDEIASVLSRNPQIDNVKIIGYTDRLGTDSYNLKLSQRRAEAVKNYLVTKGVAPTRLTAIGRGKADPVVQCSDKMARPELIKCLEPNRRVVVEEITVERRVPPGGS